MKTYSYTVWIGGTSYDMYAASELHAAIHATSLAIYDARDTSITKIKNNDTGVATTWKDGAFLGFYQENETKN